MCGVVWYVCVCVVGGVVLVCNVWWVAFVSCRVASRLVCCVLCACVDMVVRLLRVCVVCAWKVRFAFGVVVYCAVWSCVGVGAGVGVQCVFVCVCGAAWHVEKKAVLRFSTPPCVYSKHLRVYRGVLNVHTEAC